MQESRAGSLGQRLRQQRQLLNWSQRRLAEAIGATSMSINRWEHDKAVPQLHYREQLCGVFHTPADVLFGAPFTEEGNTPILRSVWNVPYLHNPLFTGRTTTLELLHEAVRSEGLTTPTRVCAISGLGGIGKTQTAVEYAYRYREDYEAILWIRAETRETLLADFVDLAALLHLREAGEHDQQRMVEAVKRWLGDHQQWLLILDNMEDLALIRDVLPLDPPGHILLTTHTQATGSLVERIDLEPLNPAEGALLLLRRAKCLASDASLNGATPADRATAQEISLLLDGLPLALDQAGAYLEETACSLSAYLDHYQRRRASLLDRRGGGVVDHPHSVTTTFSLAIERVEQANPAAADLLRLCAFLHPEAIPEELIAEGAGELGSALGPMTADPFTLDAAIKDLRAYSLLQRHAEAKTLTVHRLVQAVIKEGMDENTQRLWAERAIRAVNRAFPNADRWETWQHCQRCLPHAYSCALLIDQWNVALPQASRLIYQMAYYLLERALYLQAEALYRQALAIRERLHGPLHPDVAECLNDLGVLSVHQGRYDQAEPLYLQALALREQTQEPTHPELVHTQCNLAYLYYMQGKYTQAEPLLQRALVVREHVLGSEHPQVAESLTLLANLYRAQEKFAQANQLYQRSLAICEYALGPEHPQVAQSLNNWARLYHVQGKYTQAEPLLQRALAIREQALGPEHPQVAVCLKNLAELCQVQDKYVQAEVFYRRALCIWEKALGPNHPQTAACSEHYANVLQKLK